MILTLKEIKYLRDIAKTDKGLNGHLSDLEKAELDRKFKIEIDYLGTLKEDKLEDVLFRLIEERHGVKKKSILSKSRCRFLVDFRCAMSVILRRQYTMYNVGFIINRDHAAVNHYAIKHQELYGRDKGYTKIFEELDECAKRYNKDL